ncbi:MAG: transposase [Verrucomicrobiota bacterium]
MASGKHNRTDNLKSRCARTDAYESTQCKALLDRYLKTGGVALMDKGYDSDAIRKLMNEKRGVAVIAVSSSKAQKPPF